MPLLHQDTSRGGGGGSQENRRSLVDFFGFDVPLSEPAAAVPEIQHRHNSCVDDWRWEDPGSPEGAETPRALVPSACFPPRHTTAFASFSETACPGSGWSDERPGPKIADLFASLKALSLPTESCVQTSIQVRLRTPAKENYVDNIWGSKSPPPPAETVKQRRASFCGVINPGSSVSPATWHGTLPARCVDTTAEFSTKVFLGGLPWDLSEAALMITLNQFQPVRVEWPGREGGVSGGSPRGFAYVTFCSEGRVRALLAACRRDENGWYYQFTSKKIRTKEVQVIPWSVSDSSWVHGGSVRLEPARTVFVGALHGMLSANDLANIMNDLFQGVVYAGIDTDKNKYPIGSGRVTFNNAHSYVKAISAAYVEIRTDKFDKKVQVDPYLEDSMCSLCNLHQGPYFCRDPVCFRYFCRSCWAAQHSPEMDHKALMRNSKSSTCAAAPPPPPTRFAPPPSPPNNIYNSGTFTSDGIDSPSTSGASGLSASDADSGDLLDWTQQ